jgi:dienelactone hydrolase
MLVRKNFLRIEKGRKEHDEASPGQPRHVKKRRRIGLLIDRAAATANHWATRSRDDVGSGVYGYCYGAGTTAQPSRPAEGAPDRRTQA